MHEDGHGRAGTTRSLGRVGTRLLVAVLGISLLLMSPGGQRFATAQVNQATQEQVQAAVDEVFGPLEEIRSSLDRTRFDPGELALELAFEDAPTITDYVREHVAYQPYRGVLRGAQGALAGGAGNAWDQALLTATLLGDAGYDVEIRRASLDDGAVDRLLDEVRPPDRQEVSLEGVEVPLGEVGGAEALSGELDARMEALRRVVDGADARLSDAFGSPPGAEEAMTRVREAVRDYAWVAYRLASDDPWQEAHPLLGSDADALGGLEAEESYEADLPPEVQHRLRVQVFVEQRLGDELVAHEITSPWERPVANMYGVPLSYMNLADGIDAAPAGAGAGDVLAETSFLFPFVNGDMADGAQAFEMNGNVVDPMAAESPFAGVFQSVGGAVGDAAGMLGGLGGDDEEPPEDTVSLTAQWIEFTLIAPGGEETTHRRTVVDRIGAEARREGRVQLEAGISEEEAFEALTRSHTFMVQPGRYGEAYRTDRVAEALLATRDFAEQSWTAVLNGERPPAMGPEAAEAQSVVAPLMLFGLFDEAPRDEGTVSYRPAPALAVLTQGLFTDGAQVDVVSNPRWTLRTGDEGPTFDAATSRAAGAWETRMEGVALELRGTPGVPAYAALDEVEPADWRALGPNEEEAVAELELPAASREAIRRDLSRGYQVYAPSRLAGDGSLAGWWRVDPVTGETLGRGADGRGQSTMEYMTDLQMAGSIIPAIGFTLTGVHSCTKIEDAEQAGCCIVQNLALMPIGFAGGLVLGMAFGLSALAGFVIFDVLGGAAMSQIPPVCGS